MEKNATETPFFSFVVPVYGTERFLPRCLDSLFAQTDRDFEVIVVDDCSPGDCAAALKPYEGRVRYVRHETNRSLFQARWTGARMAVGEYVVPVDSDDYVMPELLARARALIDAERPDVIPYWLEYDDGRRVYSHWGRHPAASTSGECAIRELAEKRFPTTFAGKIVCRETLLAAMDDLAGLKDSYVNMAEDFLVLTPVLLRSRKVSFLPYAGYRYFVNRESISYSGQSLEGLRKSCVQLRTVVDALFSVASRDFASDREKDDVKEMIDDMQRFFVRRVLDGGGADLGALLAVLRETLRAEPVARELAQEVVALRASRAYRLGRALLAPLKMLRRMFT